MMRLSYMKICTCIITCLFIITFHSPFQVMANGLDQTISECIGEKQNCDEAESTGEKEQTTEKKDAPGVGFFDFIRMIAALLFVVFLLYILLKFINKKNVSHQSTHLAKNLGGVSVGGKNSVQIVKIGNEIYILGVGDEVRLIKEITDEALVEQYMNQYEQQMTQMNQPIDLVKKWLASRNQSQNVQSDEKDFQSHLGEQLRNFKESRRKTLEKLEERKQSDE